MTRTPLDAFRDAIQTWEGGYQNDPDDLGNYIDGRLLGTNRGVTPKALARYLQLPYGDITANHMQSVTLDVAADIGMKHYYQYPGWASLPWHPATESFVDFGWGAGPVLAVMSMQEMIAVAPDGAIGPLTLRGYTEWLDEFGAADAVREVHAFRVRFYNHIVDVRPVNRKYLRGWTNRANWYLPENKEWWKSWNL